MFQNPNNIGFSMPAEWNTHSATWMCYPFNEDNWFGNLQQVRNEFSALVNTIAKFEHVNLLVNDIESKNDIIYRLGNNNNVTFYQVPLNDIWFRDNGPLFITKNNLLSMVKWEFNAWGQKFNWELDNQAAIHIANSLNINYFKSNIIMEGGSLEVNGQGVAITTKQCLLNKNRNPNMTLPEIETQLKNYLGIEKIIWLENGLEGDHTDGHVDTIVRFTDENTIAYSTTNDKSDINYSSMKANLDILRNFSKENNYNFRLVPLVLPKNRVEHDGTILPCTYANFYVGNNFVVVPTYNDPHDGVALNTLQSLFPNREVIGLSSKEIIKGGGSFHCLTQQQPSGEIWSK